MAEKLANEVRRKLLSLEMCEMRDLLRVSTNNLDSLSKLELTQWIVKSLELDELIGLMQFMTEEMIQKRQKEKNTPERVAEEKCIKVLNSINVSAETKGYEYLKQLVLECFFAGTNIMNIDELFLQIAKKNEVKTDDVRFEIIQIMLHVKNELTGVTGVRNESNKQAFSKVFGSESMHFQNPTSFILCIVSAMMNE